MTRTADVSRQCSEIRQVLAGEGEGCGISRY